MSWGAIEGGKPECLWSSGRVLCFECLEGYRATAQEIADNDYNLDIPRYVDTFEEEAEIDLAVVKQEIVQLEGELAIVRQKMDDCLEELGL